MRYLLLCCIDEKQLEQTDVATRDEVMREYGQWVAELDRAGKHIASAQLQATRTAVTVRGEAERISTSDGPFAETKEQIGGYHVIECDDEQEAVSLAERIPTLRVGGVIEVRPFLDNGAAHQKESTQ